MLGINAAFYILNSAESTQLVPISMQRQNTTPGISMLD
jgi:hypothetical protein